MSSNNQLNANSSLSDLLHPTLLRGIAMIELLLRGWVESAREAGYHLSTLVHQILSVVRQHGAVAPDQLFGTLCVVGPFRRVDAIMFNEVLGCLRERELIDTEADGVLVLGKLGEVLTGHWEFYPAFRTEDEFSVRHGGETIGKLQAKNLCRPGDCIILDGRKWLVDRIEQSSKTVFVSVAPAGSVPHFSSSGGNIDIRILQEMRAVLQSDIVPAYLDPGARELLQAARTRARQAGLDHRFVIVGRDTVTWFPWVGTRGRRTLLLHAIHAGIIPYADTLSISYTGTGRDQFKAHLRAIASGAVDPVTLASHLKPKAFGKLDGFLNDHLLNQANAFEQLDMVVAAEAAKAALAELEVAA